MSEEEFWRSTPRKINTLGELHRNFKGWIDNNNSNNMDDDRVYFVDEIPWL